MNPNNKIRQIMTTNLVTVTPNTSDNDIGKIFEEHTFHHLPVVISGSKLVGIISREDYFRLYNTLSKNTSGKVWTYKEISVLSAIDIMTEYPMVLDPDDTIGLAGDIFLANKYHCLPIVETDELTGLITVHDLLAYSFGAAIESKSDVQLRDNNVSQNLENIIDLIRN